MLDSVPSLAALRSAAASLSVLDVHAFLKSRYKPDRFELRDTAEWGSAYSMTVAQSTLDHLIEHGACLISSHESVTGQVVFFDGMLKIISGERWKELGRIERDEEDSRPKYGLPMERVSTAL